MKYCCSMFEANVLHKIIWLGATWMIDTGIDGDIIIKYCPFCGTKLNNEGAARRPNEEDEE
ncbi:MAG: hypothetical protein R2685_11075 [Candidatus Nitrosocosmicus sp.]|nr:hypothetical protein [Candidatus Nitrosocosmicus sp.]